MILVAASCILFLYVAVSLLLRAPCGRLAKLACLVPLLLVSQKYVLYRMLGGSFFAPSLPRPFLLCMEALYGGLILLFFLLLLKDVLRLVAWLCRRRGVALPVSASLAWPGSGAFRAGLVVLALLGGAWGTWQAVRVPQVRTVELRLPNLPAALDGFCVVQLSDIHIGPVQGREWLQQVVERTNALAPDLIALTGDYVDGTVAALGEELAPLADLHARHGVFGVLGNHEYYWGDSGWLARLQELGVTMLRNSHHVLEVNGERMVVAGVADVVERRFGGQGPDVAASMEGAPKAFRLLLAHQPREAAINAKYADVQLSGHTHGGLIAFLQPLLARFNNGFVEGCYTLGKMVLHVSPGTGLWAGFSCRIGVPSQIGRIILRRP